jgi:hypothetical protein
VCQLERSMVCQLIGTMETSEPLTRASSGSRSCSSSVEPLMSANSAVTVLRSPSSASGASVSAIRIGASFDFFANAVAGAPSAAHLSRPFGLGLQFLEQRIGVLQVGGVEAFGEPIVDLRGQRAPSRTKRAKPPSASAQASRLGPAALGR